MVDAMRTGGAESAARSLLCRPGDFNWKQRHAGMDAFIHLAMCLPRAAWLAAE